MIVVHMMYFANSTENAAIVELQDIWCM